MEFARSQLLKYGWEEGKGLGRNETGITAAIKPKMKMDKNGIGHDVSKEYTNHWWDHVFNKTADSIQVTSTEDGVKIKRNTKHEKEISKNLQTYSKKVMKYGNFLQKATLSNGLEREKEGGQEEDDKEDDNNSKVDKEYCLIPGNEDEVFSKCGGRTAHKGARHGLKLNGKLLRIQEQEQILLDRMNSQSSNQNGCNKLEVDREESSVWALDTDGTEHSRKRKKKKKCRKLDIDVKTEIDIDDKKIKKRRKKERQMEENEPGFESNQISGPETLFADVKNKKKFRDKETDFTNEERHDVVHESELDIKETMSECDITRNQDGSSSLNRISKKKRKKKKKNKIEID